MIYFSRIDLDIIKTSNIRGEVPRERLRSFARLGSSIFPARYHAHVLEIKPDTRPA